VQHGDDAVTAQAAKNLANKHPENTTLVKAGPDGALDGHIPATRGNVKVQVVGHGDVEGGKLGGVDAPALARQVAQVKARLGEGTEVAKVTLVGCKTACGTDDQPSLKQQVQTELAKHGTEVGEVTGRNTYVKVDPDGHKHDTAANDSGALPLPPDELKLNDGNIKIITLEKGQKLYKASKFDSFDIDKAAIGDRQKLMELDNHERHWVGQYFADNPDVSRGYYSDYLDERGNGVAHLYEATVSSPIRMIVNTNHNHGSSDFDGAQKADALREYLISATPELNLGEGPLMTALAQQGWIYKGPHTTSESGGIEDYEYVVGSPLLDKLTFEKIETQPYKKYVEQEVIHHERRQATSSKTSSSEPMRRAVAESDKPLVRVAWEDPKNAAGQSHELEQAFSMPLPKGEAGQQAALERLGLVSRHLRSHPSLGEGERQDVLQKLADPEFVVRVRALASMSPDRKDKVGTAAVLGHAQLVSALLKESGTSPERASKVFETLTKSQKNPSYLNTLATNAVYDVQVAQALHGILKNLHQQMGGDEAAAKEIRTKLLDRPIKSQSESEKYDEEFYGRVFNDGSKQWMKDNPGARLLARELKQLQLIPTAEEIKAVGLSEKRAKKYTVGVDKALKSRDAHASENSSALPEAAVTAERLALALTPKALLHRKQAATERARDAFVREKIERAQGELSLRVFQTVENALWGAFAKAGLPDPQPEEVVRLTNYVNAEVLAIPEIGDYFRQTAERAHASWETDGYSGQALKAKSEATAKSMMYEMAPVRIEEVVYDATGRAVQGKVDERAQEVARVKAIEEAREAIQAKAEEEARREGQARAEAEIKRKAQDEADRKAREEVERKAREEVERKAQEEVERKA
ncbi:C80 family cysteine peptidase, partial [Burkholderia ubonensis]|uniref:C80 family cysteine peptidase n=1 Tax=Burkholderia ubonensis TaxID=101571 RepID=UPI001E4AF1B5